MVQSTEVHNHGKIWQQQERFIFLIHNSNIEISTMAFQFVTGSEIALRWMYDDNIIISTMVFKWNKANLRDLIAATGLVILLKLDSNRRFFSPCDLEIW